MIFYSLLGMSMSEKWSTGGITTLIGVGVTFFMLALLILCIKLLEIVLKGLEKSNPKIKQFFDKTFRKKKSENAVDVKTVETVESVAEEKEQPIDEDTMKVIDESVREYVKQTADDGKKHDKIRILSVKEVNNG